MILKPSLEEIALQERIGIKIFRIRVKRRLTAKEVGSLAGLHPNTIYRIETGTGLYSIVVLRRIAKVLGVGIEELIDGSPSLG